MHADTFTAVIMAGGQGQRFWPLSTVDRPKQFLDLERHGRTLLQATHDRLLPLTGGPERVYVATTARYLPLVSEQLPEVPLANVLIEPTAFHSAVRQAIELADVIVTVGVHDLIVVKHGHTVLLITRDRIDDLKRLLNDDRLPNGANGHDPTS